MEEYQIVPWDHLETESPELNLEQYVPPELERLADQVCKLYDMDVRSMTLVTSKPDKGGAIWKIETNRGPRSLKVLHRMPARSLFSVGAQEYMVKQGARVPALVLTKSGQNSVVAGGKLWIVTDWIDTLVPVTKIDLEGAAELCHGLGEFHQWSKGYIPPKEAGKSSRIFKWQSQYEKIITKIGWFRHIAMLYPETAASSHLLSVIDKFETQAHEMLKRFKESSYYKMIRKGEAHWGLAHQDYGWSNGQMGPGGIWVIDLDGVAYDLPIRDLRKIITSTMDDMGTWDLAWIRGVIEAYSRGNPMDRETFELLWIDMAFPNEFYKHTKEIVYDPVTFMNTELNAILDRVVATEANKWEVLAELEKDKSKYPSGDYPEVEEEEALVPFAYRDYAQSVDALEDTEESEKGKPKRTKEEKRKEKQKDKSKDRAKDKAKDQLKDQVNDNLKDKPKDKPKKKPQDKKRTNGNSTAAKPSKSPPKRAGTPGTRVPAAKLAPVARVSPAASGRRKKKRKADRLPSQLVKGKLPKKKPAKGSRQASSTFKNRKTGRGRAI